VWPDLTGWQLASQSHGQQQATGNSKPAHRMIGGLPVPAKARVVHVTRHGRPTWDGIYAQNSRIPPQSLEVRVDQHCRSTGSIVQRRQQGAGYLQPTTGRLR